MRKISWKNQGRWASILQFLVKYYSINVNKLFMIHNLAKSWILTRIVNYEFELVCIVDIKKSEWRQKATQNKLSAISSKMPLQGIKSKIKTILLRRIWYVHLSTLQSENSLPKASAENTQTPKQMPAESRQATFELAPTPKRNKIKGRISFQNDILISLHEKQKKL